MDFFAQTPTLFQSCFRSYERIEFVKISETAEVLIRGEFRVFLQGEA